MKTIILSISLLAMLQITCFAQKTANSSLMNLMEVKQVEIKDAFWAPRFDLWRTVTANDVLDKFEGKKQHEHGNTFANFDLVAQGKIGQGNHAGLPWFDGLLYETIRGVSDLLAASPDTDLEYRIDQYITRIAAAQAMDRNGYLNTYTQLTDPTHWWGDNGGFLRFQHDVYNAGMLMEAGIHYYKATGKTKLLDVAVRYANFMSEYMGPAPKRNIVPSHSGPEEPMLKLYWLFKENPALKNKMSEPVNENSYYDLTRFWIENRGNHCGYPLWQTWGNAESEKWIREVQYANPTFGTHSRPSWGDYAQDSISVFAQKTIEGHAVRATLLATGIASVALENHSPKYTQTAKDLWDNMVGKRMFVTGGVGAIHDDEKFGPDYFLPTDAYLETCAAVGAGFFSQRMNQLTADAKYMDEFERTLYNNVLTGISLSGTNYTYQNPLNAHKHERWEWHACPCCPPMFLKMMSAVPQYIYGYGDDAIFVNLYIGSQTEIKLKKGGNILLKQETRYPWDGSILLHVLPDKAGKFSVKLRIPGWAQGIENPYGLYSSNPQPKAKLYVNAKEIKLDIKNGYATINRKWNGWDIVELELPMQPRIVQANESVADLPNSVALASGPIVYCLEGCDNADLDNLKIDVANPLELSFQKDLLNGINIIQNRGDKPFTAIPYYAVGNREKGSSYKVWLPKK